MLLVAVFVMGAISAAAAETETATSDLNISYGNLSFENEVHLLYAVRSDHANVKLLVWSDPQSDYSYGTQTAVLSPLSERKSINGELYTIFKYCGLSAKQMTDNVYVRAYIPDTQEYGEVFKYSILQYAYNKLGKTGTATTNQKLIKMLGSMLEYGASAQEYFNYKTETLANADFVQITLTNGSLLDGFSHGLYKVGSNVEISASETDYEGTPFEKWVNSAGNTASTTATATLTAGSTNAEYTAVYTEPYTDGLSYTLNTDNTWTVSGMGSATGTEIIIPDKYEGLAVTAIGANAFANEDIASISFGTNIGYIGEGAFAGIEALNIHFDGTKAQWLNDVQKASNWSQDCMFFMTYSVPDIPNWEVEIK